jgi:hypothetical protein
MLGRTQPRPRGRPPKTANPAFRLLALSWFARRLSQERLADAVNRDLARASPPPPPVPLSIAQPALRRWLRSELPRLARPTVSIKRPELLGLRVACLLFRRQPARARDLLRLLSQEALVSRAEYWRGDYNVFAEVIALDTRQIDDLIDKFEPDAVYELLERRERTRVALRNLGKQLVR